jgi:hypothetical protein
VGFLPVFFSPQWRFGHAPVYRQPRPVDPFQLVVFHQSRLPEFLEHASLNPLLEAVVRGGTRTDAGGVQSLPLTAGSQSEEDGVGAHAVGLARFATSEAVGVLVNRQQRLDLRPEFIGYTPRGR